MWTELENTELENTETFQQRTAARPAVAFPLPASMVMTERATAALRAELVRRGFGDWIIFYTPNNDMHDLESHLQELGEDAAWEPLAALAGGEAVDGFTFGDWGAKRWPAGVLILDKHKVAMARWYWADAEGGHLRILWLIATATPAHFQTLRNDLIPFRRKRGAPVWQLIYGGCDEGEKIPRALIGPELTLDVSLRQRVDIDVVKFFSEPVKDLYRTLAVPHRRGMLLYGPPGNGKTSLIRWIGSLIPDVPGLVLRASANFDSDDLEAVIQRWTNIAPAILVIEDLDWLLKAVNISTFLNTLDGISPSTDGLLLIATTNHPEQLDPAINNRPGRFDVTIEIGNPELDLRRAFFRSRLPGVPEESVSNLAEMCDGLSFAHLQEVLRLSGLLALNEHRSVRTDEDLRSAAEIVSGSNRAAINGFPIKLEVPFGLMRRKK